MNDNWKFPADIFAASITAAAYLEYLPPIAAVLTIVYTAIRIWESKTVQRWKKDKKPALPSED